MSVIIDGTAGITSPYLNTTSNFSYIRLNTVSKASTNTAVLSYATTVESGGSDITYARSTTNGDTFTINTTGIYCFSGSATFGSSNSLVITLNSSQLSTNTGSLTLSTVLASQTCPTGGGNAVGTSWCGYLAAGSVIRFQTDTSASVSNTVPSVAEAVRVA